MSIRTSLLPLAVALAPVAGAVAQSPSKSQSDQVDVFVASEMATRKIPGMAVAIVRGGRIEKVGVYGKASLELDAPVTERTVFQINSATKSFAGVAVMMLVEAGKIRLDDPIGKHLSELPEPWKPVTVRQLVSHTSGLPDVIDSPMSGKLLARNVQDAVRLLADKPLAFAPGTGWAYNQTNYMLLAMLIERVSGMPFDRFCLEKELAPLGIITAAFGDSRVVVPGRATGYSKYDLQPDKVIPLEKIQNTWYEFEPFLYTAAALNISARDFGTWVLGLLEGKLLSRASLEEIWKPIKLADGSTYKIPGTPLGYGLGWPVIDRPTHRAAGGEGGNRASFFVYPDDGLAVIVLTNLLGADPVSLVEGIAAIYLPDLKKP